MDARVGGKWEGGCPGDNQRRIAADQSDGVSKDRVARARRSRHRREEEKVCRRSHRGKHKRIAGGETKRCQDGYCDETVDEYVHSVNDARRKVAQQPAKSQMLHQHDYMLELLMLEMAELLQR